jgi:hypothetical protein
MVSLYLVVLVLISITALSSIHLGMEKPFFLHVAYENPHVPLFLLMTTATPASPVDEDSMATLLLRWIDL